MNITNELKDKYQSFIDKGYTTKQIATELKIPWSTIKGHLRKLELKTIHNKPSLNIQKNKLEELVGKKYSTYKMATELNCSQGAIKHWLKKYELKTSSSCIGNCLICGKHLIGHQKKWCSRKCKMSVNASGMNEWYENQRNRGLKRRKKLINSKDGKCIKCGYNKCYGALTFHHRDPSIKKIHMDIRGLSNRSWEKILLEIDKCDLVCFNCHMEIHHGKNGGPCD